MTGGTVWEIESEIFETGMCICQESLEDNVLSNVLLGRTFINCYDYVLRFKRITWSYLLDIQESDRNKEVTLKVKIAFKFENIPPSQ